MTQIRCAICKEVITDFDHYLVLGYGIPLPQYSLCSKCAEPVISFLEAHGLRSFTDEQGISWKANPEETVLERVDQDIKSRVQLKRAVGKE